MEVEFADRELEQLEEDPRFLSRFGQDVVRCFRKVMQVIRAATDERDLYQLKSLHYEKLKGDRQHQRSLRLNKKWRLIVQVREDGGVKVMVVEEIEDYH